MVFTRAEIKEQAKAQLKGRLLMLFVCILVSGLIVSAATGVGAAIGGWIGPVITFVVTLVVEPPIIAGLVLVFMNVANGEEPKIGTIFEPFRTCFGKSIVVTLLVGLFVSLWSLLLFVPGIIMAYAYSQSYRIMLERPELSAMECLKESKRIMTGRKMDLFVLQLSFIPWLLLCGITFGIAGIYVVPYMQLTETHFYNRIKVGGDQEGDYSTQATDKVTNIINDASEKMEDAVGDVAGKVENTATEKLGS